MLVLKKRIGEAIVIGGNITVRVLNISTGKVRLGVEAPREVLVNRGEVQAKLDSLKREREGGCGPAPA